MYKVMNLKYYCDKCDRLISITEADVSYAYTDKEHILCDDCFREYKAKQQKYNYWLERFYNDLKQNKYNLEKQELFLGILASETNHLISILEEDYDMGE